MDNKKDVAVKRSLSTTSDKSSSSNNNDKVSNNEWNSNPNNSNKKKPNDAKNKYSKKKTKVGEKKNSSNIKSSNSNPKVIVNNTSHHSKDKKNNNNKVLDSKYLVPEKKNDGVLVLHSSSNVIPFEEFGTVNEKMVELKTLYLQGMGEDEENKRKRKAETLYEKATTQPELKGTRTNTTKAFTDMIAQWSIIRNDVEDLKKKIKVWHRSKIDLSVHEQVLIDYDKEKKDKEDKERIRKQKKERSK